MYKLSKKHFTLIRRPKEIINMENRTHTFKFLCPQCLSVYSVDTGISIFYDKPIDRSKEGVVIRPKYLCPKCKDYAFEIDEKIVDTVRYLIDRGIVTFSSCSGHPEKFNQFSFEYEDNILGLPNDEITHGAIVSILPDDHMYEDETQQQIFEIAFNTAFKKMQEKYNNTGRAIFLTPDDNSPLYFIIGPVSDIKDFRRAGYNRRDVMLDNANKHLFDAVKDFCKTILKVEHDMNRLNAKNN